MACTAWRTRQDKISPASHRARDIRGTEQDQLALGEFGADVGQGLGATHGAQRGVDPPHFAC